MPTKLRRLISWPSAFSLSTPRDMGAVPWMAGQANVSPVDPNLPPDSTQLKRAARWIARAGSVVPFCLGAQVEAVLARQHSPGADAIQVLVAAQEHAPLRQRGRRHHQ